MSVDGQSKHVTAPIGAGRFSGGGGLVVLKEGEKVIIAVGGKVRRVQV